MLLVLLTNPVLPVQEVPQTPVLLPRVLQATILLLVLDVLRVPVKPAVLLMPLVVVLTVVFLLNYNVLLPLLDIIFLVFK